jgi:hypothetical protein
MGRKSLVLALLAGLLAPSLARADDKWSTSVTGDGRVTWIDHPPTLSHINGTSLLPVTQPASPVYVAGLHFDLTAFDEPLALPLVGLDLAVGGGGYDGGAGGNDGMQPYHQDGPVWFMSLTLPGLGIGTSSSNFRWLVAVNPAIDLLETAGHFVLSDVDVDAKGDGLAFAIRARAEICFRGDEQSQWLCAVGGPTLLQGDRFLGGGYVGLGTMFR